MRRSHIFGNWKMNKGPAESREFVVSLSEELKGVVGREVSVFPPYVSLSAVAAVLKDTDINFGAQNVFFEPPGAFTGEVALEFLIELGCRYVIVGHSERRKLGEDDKVVNKKLKRVEGSGIVPVVCIGEKLEDREQNRTFDLIANQLKIDLDGISLPFIIAYEPIWAIGTGRTATPEQASVVHSFIRQKLADAEYPGDEITILYGGSVKDKNIDQLMAESEIDGVLVGGASLDLNQFSRIVKYKE